MEIKVDSDVQSVLEFMQQHIAASKLLTVAEVLPKMARLLWPEYPQEPCSALSLVLSKPEYSPSLPDATV